MIEIKPNMLKLSNEFMNSLTKMEKYKLPIIFLGDIVFALSFFVLGCLLIYESLSMLEYLPVGILCFVSAIIYLISIVLLKKEQLYAGALASTIGILFACLIILDICPPNENPLVYYRSGCFVAVMGVCNQIVAFKRKQIRIFNSIVFVLWIIMLIRTIPYTNHDLVTTISSVGINSLGDFIALLLISSINRFNMVILEEEIEAEQKTQKNLTAITQVLEESRNGLSVGQKLLDETQKASKNISNINELYTEITNSSINLSNEANIVSDSSSKVLSDAEKMKNSASEQNSSITNTSQALLHISDEISNLSETAELRSSNMKEMLETFSAEKALIKEIVDKVKKVEDSSAGIAGFVKTVNTIANQTNLLAMNASIEAAHAGNVGKGFSVIAQEIRKLSIQTSKNAAQITEELTKNSEIVKSTTESVNNFEQYVQKTTHDMEATIEVIEQLLLGIQSINNENTNVMDSLKDAVNKSNETSFMVDDVASEVESQDQILGKMQSQISHLKNQVEALNSQIIDIQEIITTINSEAKENISVSVNINKYLG